MKRVLALLSWLAVGSTVSLGVPSQEFSVDIAQLPRTQAITFMQASTPRLVFNLKQNGRPYTDLSGYGARIHYGTSATNSTVRVDATTVDSPNGRLIFDLETTDTNTNGTFSAWLVVTNSAGGLFHYANFDLRITASSILNGGDSLELGSLVDWTDSTYTNQSAGPYLFGSGLSSATNGTTGQITVSTSGAGPGDMTKAVYDTDDNGQPDTADDSDALGGTAAASYATDAEVSAGYVAKTGATDLSGTFKPTSDGGATLGGVSEQFNAIHGQEIFQNGSAVLDAATGLAWSFSSTYWAGPFDTVSNNDAGFASKRVSSGAGGYEIAADGVVTASATQQSREFVATVLLGGRTTGTALATSDALVVEWVAESTDSATCKMDLEVWGSNATTETLVYSTTGLTVTTANQRHLTTIASASLSNTTLWDRYKVVATLYTKSGSGTYLVAVTVNGDPT